MSAQNEPDGTAAYAVSQPLFDAIQYGCDQLAAQLSQLETARDLVKSTHIDIASAQAQPEAQQYEQAILKAWFSASQSYSCIFEQLLYVTQPDPSRGKPSAGNHAHVKAVYEAAQAAQNVTGRLLGSEHSSQAPPIASRKRGAGEIDGSSGYISLPVSQPRKKLHQPTIPGSRPKTKAEKYAREAEKREKKRAARMKARLLKEGNVEQYEDISAEVQARLRAKAGAKEKKKMDRKRKRDSTGSAIADANGDGEGSTPSKPEKKKRKASQEDGAAPEDSTPKKKRVSAGKAKSSGKKVKRSKGSRNQ